jgi:ribA/ribD-fused uncharacterized protein
MRIIDSFKGKYYYLSNFYYAPFIKNRLRWDTVEHYFQAMKTTSLKYRTQIRCSTSPVDAKKAGHSAILRSDWEKIKYNIMLFGVRAKFQQNVNLQKLLLSTNRTILVEGNYWHDNIWGNCICSRCMLVEGSNLLGTILMRVRTELENITK